jgi:hypothetical protein
MAWCCGRTLNGGDLADGRPVVVLSHIAGMELTGGDADATGRVLAREAA